MATSGWLAWWCSEEGAISRGLGTFVGGYLLWVIATLIVSVGRDCTFAYAELRAASALHNAMLAAVMHAPMSFFDTTPSGPPLIPHPPLTHPIHHVPSSHTHHIIPSHHIPHHPPSPSRS